MGLHATIYDGPHGRDGLSVWPADTKEVFVDNAEGPFERKPGEPAVRILMRNLGGRKVLHAAPIDDSGKLIDMTMKGYSYIACSDGRFSQLCDNLLGHAFYGAVALHDRKEG